MKISVNNVPIEIFNGAKVKDAVISYYSQENKRMPNSFPEVKDTYGNIVAEDGELNEGNKLFLKIKKKKLFSFLKVFSISVAILSMISACSYQKANAINNQKDKQVIILSVNDMHAAIDNFPKFASIVDSLRSLYPDMLLVGAGDNQTGNPVNDRYTEKGLPIIELMNEVGFNLSTVGNHEFDVTVKGFKNLINKSKFDYINANFTAPDSMGLKINPYKIITMPNGLKVAFLGLLHLNQNGIPDSHPNNVKGITFRSPHQTAPEYMFLKDQSDIFILLTHMGFEEDVKLAKALPAGVDLIIGGHSHTRIAKEQNINNVMITQAENKLKYATLIKLTVKEDGKLDRKMELINIRSPRTEKPSIRAMVDKYNDNPELNKVVSYSTDDFTSYDQLGYLMADALKSAGETEIALVNPGGVRIDNLPKGDIRVVDVLKLDPFGNEMIFFKLTGKEIKDMMFAAYPIDDKNPFYPAGIKIVITEDSNGNLSDVQIFAENGTPLNPERTYNVAMNSYMAAVYKYEHKDQGQSQYKTTADNMIEYLSRIKNVRSYKGEKRIEYKVN